VRRGVRWSAAARADLIDIAAYIAEDNPDACERLVDRIEEQGKRLGQAATGRPGRFTGSYEKPVNPYILWYEILPEPDGSETIFILRVIHMARDWRPGTFPDP
jgi:plasmid stabilization system protein ParE